MGAPKRLRVVERDRLDLRRDALADPARAARADRLGGPDHGGGRRVPLLGGGDLVQQPGALAGQIVFLRCQARHSRCRVVHLIHDSPGGHFHGVQRVVGPGDGVKTVPSLLIQLLDRPGGLSPRAGRREQVLDEVRHARATDRIVVGADVEQQRQRGPVAARRREQLDPHSVLQAETCLGGRLFSATGAAQRKQADHERDTTETG